MKKKIKVILIFFMFILSLFSSSCMNFNCETCDDVKNTELITLTKRNKISTNGAALSVVATLSPSNISDKTVSWSLAWNSSYDFSGWAFGAPDITKYIKLTPSTDTLTCSVKITSGYKLPTYAILTCTSNSNKSVKATCRIDYVSRYYYPNVDMADAPFQIDNYDLSFERFANVCLERIDSLKSSIDSSYGSLSGDIKNIRIDYQSEWETGMGWCFFVEDYHNAICDESSYEYIMADEELYVPIIYDVYYGSTLIQANCSSTLTACLV